MRSAHARRARPARGAAAVRVSCGLAAAAALHAAALALLPSVAPMGAATPEEAPLGASNDRPMQVALLAPPAAIPPPARAVAAHPPAAIAVRRPHATRSSEPPVSGASTLPVVEPSPASSATAGPGPAPAGPAPASARTTDEPHAPAAGRHVPAVEVAFREQWELDQPPQFLHVPVELSEWLESRAAPIDARLVLFVDARGTVARVEIDGMVDEASGDLLVRAFRAAVFAPGRLGAVAVASVKRIEMRGLDEGMRVITASASIEP